MLGFEDYTSQPKIKGHLISINTGIADEKHPPLPLKSPIFLAIPAFATAPALIVVGFLMLSSLMRINFDDFTEAVPAYIATIAMPFMYSISEGISMGVISYVIINLFSGAAAKKKISPVVYVLAVIFVLKYIFV